MRSKRSLYVEALDALIGNKIVAVIRKRDWELLEEIARMVSADAPISMAQSDPAMYSTLRTAITKFHLRGWSNMTPDRVREVAAKFSETELTDSAAPIK